MKCPSCALSQQRSKVYSRGVISTLWGYTPYYDENGVYHIHDGNTVRWEYQCSNSHRWVLIGHNECPANDYPSKPKTMEVL